MITLFFAGVLLVSMAVAVTNWRHGWFAAIVCGVLQDPVRKMTPGTPAALSMSIGAVYLVILFAAFGALQRDRSDFARRFPNLYSAVALFMVMLALAAFNGLATFGLGAWKAPALSLLIYLLPIPAVLLGYTWLTREEQIVRFFRFYGILTSIALIGTVAEYFWVRSPMLGMVGMPWGYIRHLPGLQIRVLSGIYRAPDIMAWHAATLTAIAVVLAVRARQLSKAWPWIVAAAWGFLSCMISGRRKAIYMVALFGLVFLWRFARRLKPMQIALVVLLGVALFLVVRQIQSTEQSEVYAKGAKTTFGEVLQRVEGGLVGTFQQGSLLGSGLGSATQGVRHVTGSAGDYGWQEGGLGKLAAELGLPGLLAAAMLASALFRMMLRITGPPDLPGTSQLIRVALFALVVANIGNFLASAQAYSDPVLTLVTAFFVGCLFATARLDEFAVQESVAAAGIATTAAQPA
ncbi:MAG TPA: hypothetical protein VND45_00975 [Thermoanaerobaculia bacterium]|jgi:hypothetical protein|nr:hypothetical protein [Thermoanaerobaculia bacterium]